MRKVLGMTVLVFASLGVWGQEQEKQETKKEKLTSDKLNLIKADPLAVFEGSYVVAYERQLRNHPVSLELELYSVMEETFTDFLGINLETREYKTFGVNFQARYHTSARRPSPAGFYVGANIGYFYIDLPKSELINITEDSINTLKYGFFVGYQWIWERGFSLDLYTGMSYASASYSVPQEERVISIYTPARTEFIPTLGVQIGYAF